MDTRVGSYLGTEIGGKWWKRFRRDGFFARGNGEYWLDDRALCFRRYLTKAPLIIPFEKMTGLRLGTWHAGKWVLGKPILKVLWRHEGQELSSGFYVSKADELIREVEARMAPSTRAR
ncbi:MAG: hypothetical protein AB1640_06740 [bacterium]